MAEKKLFRVAVTEVLRKIVLVEAVDAEEAHGRANDAWMNGEFLLGPENLEGAEFYVLGEWDTEELLKGFECVEGDGTKNE